MSGPLGPFAPAVAADRPIDVHLRTSDIDRVRASFEAFDEWPG